MFYTKKWGYFSISFFLTFFIHIKKYLDYLPNLLSVSLIFTKNIYKYFSIFIFNLNFSLTFTLHLKIFLHFSFFQLKTFSLAYTHYKNSEYFSNFSFFYLNSSLTFKTPKENKKAFNIFRFFFFSTKTFSLHKHI